MKFIARTNQKQLMSAGKHLVTIKAITAVTAKKSDVYKDLTPQLAVRFESDEEAFTGWFNLKGYKKIAEDTYKLDEAGNRIEDPAKTKAAIEIFEKMAIHAGLASGQEFEIADLIGQELGIAIAPDASNGKDKVKYTMPASKVPAAVIVTESEGSDDL